MVDMGQEKMNKLNLGCGKDIKQGFVNVDIKNYGPYVLLMDLNKMPWNLATDYYEHIIARCLLEFLVDPFGAIKEIHRISLPGAQVEITVPYYNSVIAYPLRGFDINLVDYFTGKDNNYVEGRLYKVLDISLKPSFWGCLIPNLPFPHYLSLRHFVATFLGNIITQIEFKLEVIK